jgi:hypothetical protein
MATLACGSSLISNVGDKSLVHATNNLLSTLTQTLESQVSLSLTCEGVAANRASSCIRTRLCAVVPLMYGPSQGTLLIPLHPVALHIARVDTSFCLTTPLKR